MNTRPNLRPVRFFHRGAVVEVAGLPPTTTVLQYLREHAGCTGTKEGCAEGDCGACTVIQGELDEAGELQLRNVNACTQFLPTLDGRALLTVEDLGGPGQPNPAQQALVDCHGSQCGFCTPGFVMTMTACYEAHQAAGTRPDRQQLADALAGNLCRCTGYRPILDAGEQMFDAPARRIARAPIAAALRTLAADAPLDYGHAGALFHAPQTLAELALLRETYPEATLLAGSTDIGLWVNKQFRALPQLIYTGRVAALREIRAEDFHGQPGLWIGAAAPLEEAWTALAELAPALAELWRRFASPPVRHAGTLGGNIANGSPIGDGSPALIALGAEVVLRRGTRQRRLPLQDFYLDYMKKDLQPGEFVEALHLPRPDTGWAISAHKICKRHDSDISAVCAVLALQLRNGTVQQARFVFGGMAAIVKRAAHAEAAVVGQPWVEATAEAAAAALAGDFKPMTDMRASDAYRMKVAQNLLRKLWLETLERRTIGVWRAGRLAA
ncbi:xanthine dehydrogenase small subunit [Roseateles saccharophilus]|uniref:Xanthine dehydrogenase small subunit n=1 Tax=Roseateles saccharophilus TaxID=304 RepID=A0A4R3V8A3_ROSSA|nr:xanthine dehydrogenase small subunit [Roseateles saccharophilus]MDG0831473.1 xanthine dehydrogenase small subunit [Roseateles saccharophilus]TCU98644.1 xanthine dehydrogenase small subunit [Roseateles saccharophilus]